MHHNTSSPNKAIAYLALLAAPVLWGGALVSARVVSSALPPFTAAFVRFIITSLVLFPVVLKTEGRVPVVPKESRIPVVIAGLSGIALFNIFLFSGLQMVSAGRSSVIIASTPAVVALVSLVMREERHSPLFILSIVMAFLGASIVIAEGNPLSLLGKLPGRGDLLILGCVASWTVYSFAGKAVLKQLSPLTAIFYSSLIGAMILAIPAILEGRFHLLTEVGFAPWANLIYISLGAAGLAHVSYYYGIREVGPSRSAIFMNLEPVSAILLGAILLEESLSASLLIGTILVLAGVSFSTLVRKKN